jgi:hypothetical protein
MTKPTEPQIDSHGSGSKKPPAPPVAVMDAGEPPRRYSFPAAELLAAASTVAGAAQARRDVERYLRKLGN